jgi:hypothetical protein
VSATSGSDAWAVGNYSSYDTPGRSRTLVLHWDGTAWSTVNSPTPGPGANRLAGVSARSGSDAWAVGDHDTAVSTTTSLIAHWNGTAWANAIPRYWLTTSKGNVYNFGDAAWYGSTAGKNLPAPVVAMAPTPDGQGYWLTTSKGNVYNFGDAAWYGSTAGKNLPAPVVAMAPTPDGQGYWLTTSKGNVYNFGDAAWYGSTAGKNLPAPVVDIDGAN